MYSYIISFNLSIILSLCIEKNNLKSMCNVVN